MENTIRVTKRFNFEAAHVLHGYDGKCKNIHGHSYNLYVTVIGTPLPESVASPKVGMVIDFSILKDIVKQSIIDPFDHALILNGKTSHSEIATYLKKHDQKVISVDYQPTCENMVSNFARVLKSKIILSNTPNVRLFSIRLFETESSYCEWFSEENE